MKTVHFPATFPVRDVGLKKDDPLLNIQHDRFVAFGNERCQFFQICRIDCRASLTFTNRQTVRFAGDSVVRMKYHVSGKSVAVGCVQTMKFKCFSKFSAVSSTDFISTLGAAIAPGLVGVKDFSVFSSFAVTAKTSIDDRTVLQTDDEETISTGG